MKMQKDAPRGWELMLGLDFLSREERREREESAFGAGLWETVLNALTAQRWHCSPEGAAYVSEAR